MVDKARVAKELRKLKTIYKDIPQSKKKLCEGLMQNAAFMAATLEDLQEKIAESGPVITQVNGNGFETTMEHPAQKSYCNMVARYNGVIKQLADLLPDNKADTVAKAGENLAAFIAKGKPVMR